MAAVFFISIPLVLAVLWLGHIRPYCIRHGKGYTPGGNAGVTFWVDWEEAREIAREKGDGPMILVCRLVFWLQVLFVIGILSVILYQAVSIEQEKDEEPPPVRRVNVPTALR